MNFSAFWYLNFAREYRWIVSQDAEIKSDGLGSFAVRDPEFKMRSVEDQLLYKVEYRGSKGIFGEANGCSEIQPPRAQFLNDLWMASQKVKEAIQLQQEFQI